MVSKKEIDNYFSEHYDELVEYTAKLYSKNHRFQEDPYALISFCYEYLIDKQDLLEDETDIRKFISTYLYNNTYWTNGDQEGLKQQEKNRYIDCEGDLSFYDKEYKEYEEDDFEEKQMILNMYYQQAGLFEKSVYEIYFFHNRRLIREFAEYIQLSNSVAQKYIRNMKDDIQDFYKRYKENNINKNINKL